MKGHGHFAIRCSMINIDNVSVILDAGILHGANSGLELLPFLEGPPSSLAWSLRSPLRIVWHICLPVPESRAMNRGLYLHKQETLPFNIIIRWRIASSSAHKS